MGPGLALGATDQLVPSQDWMRVLKRPNLFSWTPTAVQVVAEVQDTPERSVEMDPGWGLGTTDQLVPFQDSMRVLPAPLLLPTAMHAAAEVQDTLLRLSLDPGLGLGTTDQVVPFQDSMTVLGRLPLFR